jgi:hypothetical protein
MRLLVYFSHLTIVRKLPFTKFLFLNYLRTQSRLVEAPMQENKTGLNLLLHYEVCYNRLVHISDTKIN